jgi:hypothetical protein
MYLESINTNKAIDLGLPILNKIKVKLEKENSKIYDKVKKMIKIISDRANQNNISITKISLKEFKNSNLKFSISFYNELTYEFLMQVGKDFTKDGKSLLATSNSPGSTLMKTEINLELI